MSHRANQKTTKRYIPGPMLILMSVVIFLMLSAVIARTSYADTVTIRPDGVIAAGGWTNVTAANLNDSSDATYATITGALSTFTVSIANDAAYSGATINSVTVWTRGTVVGGGGQGESIIFGSSAPTLDKGGAATLSDDPTISSFSYILTGITTDAEIDALEVDVETDKLDGGEEARIMDVWVVVNYTPAAGQNQITTCDGCHTQPPAEGASRDGATGAVIGSHAAHNAYSCTTCHPNNAVLNHRGGQGASGIEGQIDMLANIQGGTYSLGSAGFLQDNEDGTGLGTCSDVACHGGAASVTPQWGDGTGLDCTGCHGAPPATNAHTTHYTAKGWTNPDTTGATCDTCHPDNTVTHSDVTDGTILLDAALTPSGTSPTISCGTAPVLGCHNGKATPNWDTGTAIGCLDCHTAGGADTADPVSGLHDETPTVSGVIHNPSDASFTGCEDCHTAAPSATHYDATFDTPSVFDAMVGYSAGAPPTCTATCHIEDGTSGPWARLWHENSDLSDGSECAGCHGDWTNGWNTGVTHRADADPQSVHGTGTSYDCKDCHALEAGTGYTFTIGTDDWGGTSNHGNTLITMNTNGVTWGRSGGLSGCSDCHLAYDGTDGASNQHSFTQTGWTPETVSGDAIESGCDSCHGGATAGASKNNYWPDGTNTLGDNTSANNSGMHLKHMEMLADYVYGETIATLLSDNGNGTADAKQKNLCGYCHVVDPNDGDHGNSANLPAETDIRLLWDKATADANDAWSSVDGTCSNVDCHNSKATVAASTGWYDGYTPGTDGNCLVCHTVGGAGSDPTTGLHDETPTVSGTRHDNTLDATGCAVCHDDGTGSPSSGHWNGTFQPSAPTIQFTAAAAFTDGTPPTCASNCHYEDVNAGETWSRLWHENSDLSDGSECAGCHGDWVNGWNAGVSHRSDANPRTNHGTGTAYECLDCHALEAGSGYAFTSGSNDWNAAAGETSNHGNALITINSNGTSFARGTGADAGKSGCSACHNAFDGTVSPNHSFATTNWALETVSGDAISSDCTSCHDTGKSGQIVTPASPHVVTTVGGTFNACEDCHPGGLVGSLHSATGVVGIPNNTSVGINYQDGISGGGVYSGYAGIVLGGDATTGTTEADICWNCHDQNNNGNLNDANEPNEWGTNTNGTYNYGTLSTKSWFAAGTWTSANFTYKDGSLNTPPGGQTSWSSHDNMLSWPAATSESINDLSCTYCHDVHDTNTAPGDTASGKPYLRGAWNSSPYPEDGAPRAGDVYNGGGTPYGDVPRGNTNTTGPGGFQIDQNNGNPNGALGTYAATDGLCSLCHDMATLVTQAPLHSNPLGYSDSTNDTSAARNIFQQSDRQAALTRFDPGMAYQNTDGATMGDPGKGWMGGLRNKDFDTGIAVPPTIGGRYGYQAGTFEWGVTMDDATVDVDFHNFTCSKCHTPHASRLPRLMITNCLDTSVNTWDDQYQTDPNWSNWPGVTPGDNYQLSEAHTAQNCHRDTGEASGPGWNTVTPW